MFKLYAWEEVLETRVLGARAKEISITKGYYFRMFTLFAVNQSADVLFFLAIFGIYYARGKEIKIDTIFIAIGLIGILKSALFFTGWVITEKVSSFGHLGIDLAVLSSDKFKSV